MASVEQLVAKLKELGGSANNPDLKAALAVKDKEWDLIKKSALKSGVVVLGRGFGGRLVFVDVNLVLRSLSMVFRRFLWFFMRFWWVSGSSSWTWRGSPSASP